MKAAGIIAAGLGSRLKAAHPEVPKPLVPVRGRPLVEWVVSGLRKAGAESIVILLNSGGDAVRAHLHEKFPQIGWTFLRADTASSWESFRMVSLELADRADRFLISTTDALLAPADVASFSRQALLETAGRQPEAALALTRFVDDEKPLFADVDDHGFVTAAGDAARTRGAVTCGLYALTRRAAGELPAPAACARLRDFWIRLVAGGRPVRGVLLGDAVDVDRPADLPAAEKVTSSFER